MDTKLADKIRKLLALGESKNEHEAAAAMAAAHRLCEEHRLSLAEVEAAGGTHDTAIVDQKPVAVAGKFPIWQRTLLFFLSEANGCVSLSGSRHVRRKGGGYRLMQVLFLAGRENDIEATKHLFAFASTELARLCERECCGLGTHFRLSWMLGAVHGVQQQIDRSQRAARSSASTTAIALVDARQEEADQAARESIGKFSTRHVPMPTADSYAYDAGRRVGRTLDLLGDKKLNVGVEK